MAKVTPIEEMPAGARLTGIVYELHYDEVAMKGFTGAYRIVRKFQVKPDYIEVHDDVIVLMVRRLGRVNGGPTAEINIKVGTLVEWEI